MGLSALGRVPGPKARLTGSRGVWLGTQVVGVLAALAGCAPVYIPSAALAPAYQGRGNTTLALHLGTQGVQAGGGIAVTDRLAVRALGHYSKGEINHHSLAAVGLGMFHGQERVRTGVSLQAGGGASRGRTILKTGDSPMNGTFSGQFLHVSAQGDVTLKSPIVAVGLVGRVVSVTYAHDSSSDATGVASWLFAEPILFLRFGHRIHLEMQAGVSLPVVGGGNLGGYFPFIFSLGGLLEL